ncbi:MAG TPA: 5-formyltetrahydrofolate cyclo-ligase [Steroidobacteraceae bacterium]|nr:5-formyltetrahydrofolate cyclo-ligase [Steroidobacteraceae bacterium]
MADARRALRASLRAKRRAVPAAERADAARQVARHADCILKLRPGQRIGIYAATAEELDTSCLIALALRRGCLVYLPRIDRRAWTRTMRFVPIPRHTPAASLSPLARKPRALRSNRFGIAEPEGPALASARLLDVVFLPLVGFDRRGVRLGMGGGYYDRALGFRRLRAFWHSPLLIGIGYAVQEVQSIVPAAHDVPLDLVITEHEVMRCACGG